MKKYECFLKSGARFEIESDLNLTKLFSKFYCEDKYITTWDDLYIDIREVAMLRIIKL